MSTMGVANFDLNFTETTKKRDGNAPVGLFKKGGKVKEKGK